MALETTDNRKEYAGNGVTTNFSFPYYFLAEADLVVILKDNTTLAETPQVLTTNYTVTGEGLEAGGSITMLVAPASGKTLVIYRDPDITQESDYRENDALPAEQVEQNFDKLTMISQRLAERLDRKVGVSEGFTLADFDLNLPSDLNATGNEGKVVVVNATLDGFEMGPSATEIEDSAAAAAASASAASASASAASSSASSASTSASTATTQAAAASASAAAAALAAASNIWRDVVFLTSADSPRTILSTERGKLFACDTSSGNIVINLPTIAGLDLSTPFTIGFKKTSTDGNSITLTRGGTDTIDGSTTKVISVSGGGTTLIPDTDPSPDRWTSADFGAAAGNLIQDKFSGNGSTTGFTLSTSPGSENNTFVFISGVYQSKETYSVSGATLTFSTAPPTGTDNIEVMIGTLLSIGTPSDGTVSPEKLAAASIPNNALYNLGIATSVAASALTIALKQADGATDPATGAGQVKVGMRSSTLTSGVTNIRSVSAALSLVISSGSTLGCVSAVAADLFVYLIDNAGTLELAVSRTYFEEGGLISTTAEGGAGAADSFRAIYSTTARSNVPFRLIGKINITEATAGTWASNATSIYAGLIAPRMAVARARSTSAFSIVASTDTKLTFTAAENSDNTGMFDDANDRWILPKTKRYLVGGYIRRAPASTHSFYVGYRINSGGSTILIGLMGNQPIGVTAGVPFSDIIEATAGDTLELRAQTTDTTIDAYGIYIQELES